jgi:hypothetical protein
LDSIKATVAKVQEFLALVHFGKLTKAEQNAVANTRAAIANLSVTLDAIETDAPTPEEKDRARRAEFHAKAARQKAKSAAASLVDRLERMVRDVKAAVDRYEVQEPKDTWMVRLLAYSVQGDMLWGVANMQPDFAALYEAASDMAAADA